ncbi:hypothetical protein [Paenibacillus motobuensis]|uniref:Uncharacterized protein n=1 Tax=Paenibacillus motobuensis TaxID=295324 RepID=A0ABN0YI75_9BACL
MNLPFKFISPFQTVLPGGIVIRYYPKSSGLGRTVLFLKYALLDQAFVIGYINRTGGTSSVNNRFAGLNQAGGSAKSLRQPDFKSDVL